MFKNFNQITEAAVQRLNEIANEIDGLRAEHEAVSEVAEKLENMDRQLTAEESKQLNEAVDRWWQTDSKIEQLDDERHELRGFLENFTNAVEKSSNIEHFLLFMQGYDAAYVYGDAPDTHPWH